MLPLIVYLLVVSALLALSALLAERILRLRHRSTRGLWLLAMLASLMIPVLVSSIGVRSPDARAPEGEATNSLDPEASSRHWPTWIDIGAAATTGSDLRQLDRLLELLWITSSVLTGSVFLVSVWQVRRRRRTWQPGRVAGIPVLIARDAGPAVLGFLRPEIVVPEWFVHASPDTQRYVMAHENAHVQSGDAAVLTLSILLLALTPWNPLLWWQAQRLRLAIEVDCDRRVIGGGHDPRRYAKVLMLFGLRRSTSRGAMVSMSESPSTLERRITLMIQPKRTQWTVASLASALLAVGSATATTRINPPSLLLTAVTPAAADGALNPYTGSYEFASLTVLEIAGRRNQLSATFPGTPPDLLVAHGSDEFRFGDVDAAVQFKRDTKGHIIGLTFVQNGETTYAPRLPTERVRAIRREIEERFRKQSATPGSDTALRRLIEGIQSGKPDYAEMSPQLAGGTRTMLQRFQATMLPWGTIKSVVFKGVNQAGWDQYAVTHLHGNAAWQIALDEKGVIVGALVDTGI